MKILIKLIKNIDKIDKKKIKLNKVATILSLVTISFYLSTAAFLSILLYYYSIL